MNWLQKMSQYKPLPVPFGDTVPENPDDLQGGARIDRTMSEETAKMEEKALSQMQYLGQGNQGIVYELDNKVIKYTNRPAEYRAALNAFRHPVSCIVPVLEEPKLIQERTRPDIWRIVLEKVEILQGEDWDIIDLFHDVISSKGRADETTELKSFDPERYISFLEPMPNKNYEERFRNLYNIYMDMLHCLEASGYKGSDTHADNVGIKDGRMVLIDLGMSL